MGNYKQYDNFYFLLSSANRRCNASNASSSFSCALSELLPFSAGAGAGAGAVDPDPDPGAAGFAVVVSFADKLVLTMVASFAREGSTGGI